MRPKKGKVLPEMGKELHQAVAENGSEIYAQAIAVALRDDLGATHQAIKSAMRWTGASERTVKYWFAGTVGPSGEHLIALARHSDAVLTVFLRKAGRHNYADTMHLIEARKVLSEVLTTIQEIVGEGR